MKAEAEANAETDRKAKEEAEKVNQADSLIFQTEKQLKEFGDKIPAEKKATIETALSTLKAAHQSKDLAGIDAALESLNAAWAAASEDMYKATQQAPQNEQQNQNQPGESQNAEVTDVDFEEVK
jgi:molecular chaperone DnaK